MRAFSFTTMVLLLGATAVHAQDQPIPLRDGQQVTITGRLTMEPGGRLQFVTVKTSAAYVAVSKDEPGGKNPRREVLHEIGLAGYSDYGKLYAHRGQQVTVAGHIQIDNLTPYFWHGTRLAASSIRLADGVDLLHAQATPRGAIAADTGTYEAAVLLPSDLAAPWVYSLNGQPVGEGRFLYCSSNGGGDVVNCYCAQGFHAVQVESVGSGAGGKGRLLQGGTAQVDVGENTPAPATKITVTCSR